jgi:Domain of unknown function (DUF4386)
MTELLSEASPRLKARFAGLFQILEGITSSFGQVYLLGTFVVTSDPAATAANILANETLFQIGFAASLIAVGFHLARTLFIYELFKIVNRSLSVLAVFVILVGCAIQALTSFFYLAPLIVLKAVHSALTTEQLQELAYLFIRLNAQAFNIYLVFFGLWCFLVGYLIYRSNFMPPILGVLLMITGVGWMTYLFPSLARQIFPLIATASGLGEIPLLLWLLVKGVNAESWKEQARTRQAPSD